MGNTENIKFKATKKLETKYTKAPQSRKLSDDDLEGVAGGFWETDGWAANQWIQCPVCGRDAASAFNSWIESDRREMDGYRCQCGYVFGVDSNGQYWELGGYAPI